MRAAPLVLFLLVLPLPLRAISVRIEVEGVERDLERNIRSSLSLGQEDEDELTEERIRRLHADAPDEIEEALQPFGYYRPVIDSELTQEGERWTARYTVDAGPAIKIASLDLRITGGGEDDPLFRQAVAEFPVKQGAVLYHPDYEQGKGVLTDLAAENGYLDAAFEESQVRVDLERYQADVVVHYDTGPRYRFGEVRFNQDVLNPDLLTGYVKWKRGDPLDVDAVLDLQSSLSDSPYWSRVEVVTNREQAVGLEVPIDVNLEPAKPQRFSGGLGYGTDTGPRATGMWELRRINRRGHRAEAEARVSEIEQSARMSYFIPGPFPRTDLLSLNTAYQLEKTDTSESETYLIGGQRTQQRRGWREAVSLNYQREDFEVGLDSGITNLLVPGASWERIRADDRIYATNGQRLRFSIQGADESLLSDASFLQANTQAKVIRTFAQRHRLIGRAEAGYTETDELRALPPRYRFFAGGDQSVRGYAYQELGPEDEAGNVIGGESLLVGSIEYEFRLIDFPRLEDFSVAAFFDAGNASSSFGGEIEQGAGLGIRWRSPIGPIRADFAFALSQDGTPFRFHLNIGPDL